MMRNKGKKLICWLLTLALLLSIGAGMAYAEESETTGAQTVGAEETGSDTAVPGENTVSETEKNVTKETVITSEITGEDAEAAQEEVSGPAVEEVPNTDEVPAQEAEAAADEAASGFQPAETLDTHLTGEDSVYETVLDNLAEALLGEAPEVTYVAQVVHSDESTTPYETVSAAISGAAAGETVQLLCDVPITSKLTISKNLTFDLNGYGLISSGVQVFYAESKTWTLEDSSPDRSTHYYTVDEEGVAHVSDDPAGAVGSFTGGYITGVTDSSGTYSSCIYVWKSNTTMTGGTVIGNRKTSSFGGAVYIRDSGTFNMEGGAFLYNRCTSGGGAIGINGGTLNVKGGSISHNTTTSSGGAIITWSNYANVTVNISGGEIIGNHADGNGGGICAPKTSQNKQTTAVNISGGVIAGNSANTGGGVSAESSKISLKMTGGTIEYNEGSGATGGVRLASSTTFNMSGGTIRRNLGKSFGGVGSSSSTVKLSGTIEISDNYIFEDTAGRITSDGAGYALDTTGGTVCNVKTGATGERITVSAALDAQSSVGVTLPDGVGTFTSGWTTAMGEADPADFFTSDNAEYGVLLSGGEAAIGVVPHVHDEISFTAWNSTNSLPTAAGSYYLTADVTIGSRWDVPTGTVNLCLNGHSITRTGASGTTGSVIQVGSGATLNLYDCGEETRYYTVANPEANGAGLGTVVDESTYNASSETARGTFTGGYITGGNITGGADANHLIGGGVNVVSGTFTMNGGTIFGNRVCINGGGVKVKGAGASFTMNGGAILANYNDCYGGAISVGDNGSNRLCTVTINGGTIAHNWSGRNGGALHLDSYNHTFTITGGTIINNHTDGGFMNGTSYSAGRAGGGVLKDGVLLKLSGAPVFSANSNKGYPENNLNLMGGKTDLFDLSGHLTDGADIGVYVSGWSNPASTDYRIATGAQMSDVQYIHYDIPSEATIVYCDGAKDWAYLNGAFVEYGGTHHTHAAGTVWATASMPAAFVITGETTLTYATFADALSAWTDGTTLKLMKDVTTTATISVSGTKMLDLNGLGIKAGGTGYSVITVVSGADLTITDSAPDATDGANRPGGVTGGYITGGSVGQNYGGGVTVDGGVLRLTGGAITANANTYGGIGNCGGGVHVRSGGALYMTGGEISGNTSYVGGGVGTDTSATTVSVTGGVIQNNQTERFGSAIFAGRSGSAILRIAGDARIVGNISKWTEDKDGEGTVNSGSSVLLSGNPTVHGDWKTNGTSSPNTHINLDNDGSGIQRVELEGALTNETGTPNLTVTPLYRWNDLKSGKTFIFTRNWNTYMGAAHPADYFKVDDGVTGVRVIRKDGEAAFTGSSDLGDLYVTFLANGGTGTMDPQLVTGTSATLNASTFTHSSFGFAGWNTDPEGKGTAYANKAEVTLTGDLTLYAQWTDILPETTPNAAFTANGVDSGTLTDVTAGMKYSVDGGTTWTAITDTSVTITGVSAANGVQIYMTGNGTSTSDSDVQSITVTKAAKPSLTVTQPETGDTGSISATAAHEYSADDGASWTACVESQSLAAGSYRVRVKATGTVLASDAQIVTITKAVSGAGGTEYVIDGKTVKTELNVEGDSTPAVTVKNLDLEATEQSESAEAAVTLAMSVEAKPAESVGEETAAALIGIASEQSTLEYLNITVSKTVGETTESLAETQNVLEIIVPYSFTGKTAVTVYRYHDGAAEALTQADTKADGTFRLDEENGRVYIYASRFSTYAISFIQCYNLIGSIQYSGFAGDIKLELLNANEEPVMDLTNSNWSYSFTHIPKGSYYLQAAWTEAGVEHTLKKLIEIN